MASGFYISRPRSYNEEELENDMGYSARSRTFMRGGEKGKGGAKFLLDQHPFRLCTRVTVQRKSYFEKRNYLPIDWAALNLNGPPTLSSQQSISSAVYSFAPNISHSAPLVTSYCKREEKKR